MVPKIIILSTYYHVPEFCLLSVCVNIHAYKCVLPLLSEQHTQHCVTSACSEVTTLSEIIKLH